MIIRYIKSNKGSSLVMIIFFMMILIMLGTTIMSLALTNFKMKLVDEKVKTSLYIAESGLEEAYAIIEQEVKNAIDYANKEIEDNFDRLKEEYTYTDDEGNERVDKSELERKLNELFETSYKNYLTTDIEGEPPEGNKNERLIDKIKNASYIYAISIAVSDVDEFSRNPDTFDMKITSTYTSPDGIEKSVSQKFSIKIPSKNDEYKMSEPYYIQYDTKLYNLDELGASGFIDNALTAIGDIIFNHSSTVTINGSVHANGDSNGNGILIKSGTVYVNIDDDDSTINKISTPKDIKLDGDNIKVKFNTDVFCNTLAITENSENSNLTIGSSGGTLTNKFRVFTEDDLELNGKKSHINIYGSYYGFSDGSSLTSTHDDSSAIVINSMDLGEEGGSSLTITGEASENNEFSDGILIYGTTYIDKLYDENKTNKKEYQTGESVSIIGNYVAYTDIAKDYLADKDNYEYNPYYYFYTDTDNVELRFADKFNGNDLKIFDISGKSKSSIIKEVFNNASGLLTVDGIYIPPDRILHSTGAYVSDGTINNDKFKESYNVERLYISDKYDKMTTDSFISLTNEPTKIVNEVFEDEDDIIKLVYINTKNSNSITIGNLDSTINVPSDKEIHGIIITQGDITIEATIKEFKGIIASGGNITFQGNGDKKITYDKGIEVIVTEEALGFEDDSDVKTYKNYSDLIEVEGWRIDK